MHLAFATVTHTVTSPVSVGGTMDTLCSMAREHGLEV